MASRIIRTRMRIKIKIRSLIIRRRIRDRVLERRKKKNNCLTSRRTRMKAMRSIGRLLRNGTRRNSARRRSSNTERKAL